MKLLTFKEKNKEGIHFGVAVRNVAVSFRSLERKRGKPSPELRDMESYLTHLPHSETIARELRNIGEQAFSELDRSETFSFDEIKILPAVPTPGAILDFSLAPEHLERSAKTLLRYEYKGLRRVLMNLIVKAGIKSKRGSEVLPYYKCNHHSVIGDEDETSWPSYTAYLDIEPELAFVTGDTGSGIAGYLIFNDWSARDVQMPEMFGTGPTRSKDFNRSNGLGPFLVTPDEITNPLDLAVNVYMGSRYQWEGSTSAYTHHPSQVLDFVRSVFTPKPGTVIGMGTIPGCTGLDHDAWLEPGDLVKITFDHLGTLRQSVPKKMISFETSRWKRR